MTATLEIRSQADADRMFQSVADDFDRIRWEDWMQTQMRRLEAIHNEYFNARTGPDGVPWAPNSPATIRRKGHGRQLEYKLRLRPAMTQPLADAAIRMTIDEWPLARIIWGNDLPYSPLNDQGTSRTPARPHIGISGEHLDQITESAADYAVGAIKR